MWKLEKLWLLQRARSIGSQTCTVRLQITTCGGLFESTKRSSAKLRTDTITHSATFVIKASATTSWNVDHRTTCFVWTCSDMVSTKSTPANAEYICSFYIYITIYSLIIINFKTLNINGVDFNTFLNLLSMLSFKCDRTTLLITWRHIWKF